METTLETPVIEAWTDGKAKDNMAFSSNTFLDSFPFVLQNMEMRYKIITYMIE